MAYRFHCYSFLFNQMDAFEHWNHLNHFCIRAFLVSLHVFVFVLSLCLFFCSTYSPSFQWTVLQVSRSITSGITWPISHSQCKSTLILLIGSLCVALREPFDLWKVVKCCGLHRSSVSPSHHQPSLPPTVTGPAWPFPTPRLPPFH